MSWLLFENRGANVAKAKLTNQNKSKKTGKANGGTSIYHFRTDGKRNNFCKSQWGVSQARTTSRSSVIRKKKYNGRQLYTESNVTITYVPPETLVDRILGFEYESKRHQQAAVIYFKGGTKLTIQW